MWLTFACFAVLCFSVSFVGTKATFRGLQGWYQSLKKPSWTPPNWVFAPVWTLLYALMALAATYVWLSDHPLRGVALAVFALQLALNLAWSWIFFGFRLLGLGALEIVLMWAAIAANLVLFIQVNAVAGLLLAPYLLWVSFASALNIAVWRLNPPARA